MGESIKEDKAMRGLIDSTLREGGQTPGVQFSLHQKIAIARAIAAVGIEEIELGVATRHDAELEALFRACRTFPRCPRLSLWCRCRPEDIAFAARLKPDIISLSLPASDLHINKRLSKSRSWVLEQIKESVALAGSLGIPAVSLGLEDSSRADRAFLTVMIACAVTAGVQRVRLADTVGVLTPGETSALIAFYRKKYPGLEIALHAHNDFGMASANAFSALENGADWADVTVLGLGERAGCARLEELTGMLSLVKQQKKYRVDLLRELCLLVAGAAGRAIAVNQPMVGNAIFTCETGLHVHGVLADPSSYEPFPPERVKARRSVLLGAKSGNRAVAGYYARMGLAPATSLPTVVARIRQKATELGRPLLDSEVVGLIA